MELEIKNKGNSNNKGFTLIELLVAMAVFSLLVIVLGGIAASSIKSQRKAFALQSTQESGRYLLESISKELRMSIINTGAGSDLTTLNITNSQSQTFDYQFDNVNKKLLRAEQPISPDNLEVTGAFYVREESSPARKMVTLIMKMKSSGAKIEEESEVYLQSTIAPRNY